MKLRVRFRILVDLNNKTSQLIMRRSSCVFTQFMLYANSMKLTSQDHVELAKLHRVILDSTKLLDVLPCIVNRVSAENYNRLISVSSVFDISPVELKAYMLLVSGVQSMYIGEHNAS